MCGIAGIIGPDIGNYNIRLMLEKIRHRGPDGLHYWRHENIAFGHARLRIIDLSAAADQPMIDPELGNVIIFNGEIYNYREIKKAIGSRYHFKTHSDTEVLLAAYAVLGVDGLDSLRGMFAFALYDMSKNKVLLARDRLGIKPLYYRATNGCFYFASEIKALINTNSRTENINEVKLYEFLANRQLDTNHETFFKAIFQLPAAHYTWVDMDGHLATSRAYWQYPQLGTRSFDKQAKEELNAIFAENISVHMRADVEVGTFLSGGIDSSSITCFALRGMEQETLHTFSGILPYHHEENILIEDVLKTSGRITPHKFLLDGKSFFDDIQKVIYHHDEPILDGSMYSHYMLCKVAHANNSKVLLSGAGGDELFGGYGSYINAYHAGLLSAFRLKKYFSDLKRVAGKSSHTFSSLIVKSLYESLPFSVKRNFKNRQIRIKNGHLEIHPFIEHYFYEDGDRYYANVINNYCSWTVPPYLHYEDRNSMAFGIEIRVPFYDHKLMEFAFQFSPDQVINGTSKSILRESFRDIVPAKVLDQKGKFGFPSPIDHALATDLKGSQLFFDLLKKTPFLKHRETEKLAIDFYKGKGSLTTYWRLLSYILWYDVFFSSPGQVIE